MATKNITLYAIWIKDELPDTGLKSDLPVGVMLLAIGLIMTYKKRQSQ